jgi:hypothetical protein
MKDELVEELVASVREGGAILRGEATAARKFVRCQAHSRQLQPVAGGVCRSAGN